MPSAPTTATDANEALMVIAMNGIFVPHRGYAKKMRNRLRTSRIPM